MNSEDWRMIGLTLAESIREEQASRIKFLIKICVQCTNVEIHPFQVTDEHGNNVLHYAVLSGEAGVVQRILDNFDNAELLINATNENGEDVISLGVKSGNPEISKMLERYRGGYGGAPASMTAA